MKICVQGLWHLGTVTAAALASVGHDVTGLDLDAATIAGLQEGQPPLFEPGLEQLLRDGLAARRLRFVADPAAIPADIELLWIAYDTPVDDDDEADVEFVVQAIARTLPHLRDGVTVLVSSQLPVGSCRRLEALARDGGKSVSFACSPENLRLGKALDVFLKPDRVVVGVRSENDRTRIAQMLAPITERVEWMSVESAEMTKHAINAFLATSVVFANEIAAICEQTGADAKEVERGLKSESRIGPKAYLSPGGAFAGGTLARDVEFLRAAGGHQGLSSHLLGAIRLSNDEHKQWPRKKLHAVLGQLQDRRIAIWGLTYKAGTSTLRRSLSVELCEYLIAQGARLAVHDPAAETLPAHWTGKVERVSEPLQALATADALVVATEWPDYKTIPASALGDHLDGLVVLDANRLLANWVQSPGLRYFAVGSPDLEQKPS